jgi:uncharacterized protein GlcG (DUF336 family)
MRGLNLEEANAVIAATFAAAKKRKCRPRSAIVLDAGGRVRAFQKQDGASMLRFVVGIISLKGLDNSCRQTELANQLQTSGRGDFDPGTAGGSVSGTVSLRWRFHGPRHKDHPAL